MILHAIHYKRIRWILAPIRHRSGCLHFPLERSLVILKLYSRDALSSPLTRLLHRLVHPRALDIRRAVRQERALLILVRLQLSVYLAIVHNLLDSAVILLMF